MREKCGMLGGWSCFSGSTQKTERHIGLKSWHKMLATNVCLNNVLDKKKKTESE